MPPYQLLTLTPHVDLHSPVQRQHQFTDISNQASWQTTEPTKENFSFHILIMDWTSLDVLPQWTAVNNCIRKAVQKRLLILDQILNRNLPYFTLWCFAVLSDLPPPNSWSINFILWSCCHQRWLYHLCSLPLSVFSGYPETSQQKSDSLAKHALGLFLIRVDMVSSVTTKDGKTS